MDEKIKSTDKVGYLMLGVCLDYFFFKPVRTLKPLWTFWVGVAVGVVYSIGVENLMNLLGRG